MFGFRTPSAANENGQGMVHSLVETKKTDAAESPQGFRHAGLLCNSRPDNHRAAISSSLPNRWKMNRYTDSIANGTFFIIRTRCPDVKGRCGYFPLVPSLRRLRTRRTHPAHSAGALTRRTHPVELIESRSYSPPSTSSLYRSSEPIRRCIAARNTNTPNCLKKKPRKKLVSQLSRVRTDV